MGPGTDTARPARDASLFRKNSLDEMTVGRTEKPVGGTKPQKPGPPPAPDTRSTPDANRHAPHGKPNAPHGEPVEPRRDRIGLGSYEDAGEAKQSKRRPGKTGRPGR